MTLILPAVDVSRGRCVRLTRGKIEETKVYYDDPLEAAKLWEGMGAEALHLIDLDAAIGIGNNVEAIKRIIKAVGIPAEVGGGIRSVARAKEYADAGACRVIFGPAALELKFIMEAMRTIGRERVMAAVDHLMGRVAVKGWQELAQIDALTLCRRLEEAGVARFMMTSIDRDGAMKGPNLEYSLKAASALRGEVYLAGGFTTLSDLGLLKGSSVKGVIVGKALYEKTLDLRAAMEAVR